MTAKLLRILTLLIAHALAGGPGISQEERRARRKQFWSKVSKAYQDESAKEKRDTDEGE